MSVITAITQHCFRKLGQCDAIPGGWKKGKEAGMKGGRELGQSVDQFQEALERFWCFNYKVEAIGCISLSRK